jgi:rhodanese-related sulfurtransferase
MSAQVIDAIRLQDWLKKKEAPLLLDVLPEESYNQEHLPGAQRATVYEVSFLDQVQKLVTGSESFDRCLRRWIRIKGSIRRS